LPAERSGVVETVAAAFARDPAWAFILGEDYEALVEHFARALFDVRVARESVWVADDLAAVAMWDLPGQGKADPQHAKRVWAAYRARAGEASFQRLALYNGAVATARPLEAHWYLGVLATHPDRRGRGLASTLLAHTLAEADSHGLACCLETSTSENRRFYERRGFTEATDIPLPGGPPTWWLRRAPCIGGHGR
jgi:ribosomal protein S18 acetylase RimI-like enzyme